MQITETRLADALFSTVQQRLLALLFGQPQKSFYAKEIIRTLQSGTGAVSRELEKLETSGLVSVERIGNQKHYQANPQSPVYEELRGIIQKTVGLHDPIRQALTPFVSQIHAAFVYGSIAKGTDTSRSDIDLMVIGEDLVYSDLFHNMQSAESILGRPINPTILTRQEWTQRISEGSSFIEKIRQQPMIFVIGSEAALEA